MAKKFSIKKHRLRARAKRRKFNLKTNPVTKGLITSQEQKNVAIIQTLDSKIKAIVAAQQ